MKTKYFAVVLFLSAIFSMGIQGQTCHSSIWAGTIYGDTLCIPAQDSAVWTYHYRYSEEVDTADVWRNAWSVFGDIEKVSEGFDFIQVRSTGDKQGSIRYSYQLKSDQNRSCVKSGCVSYSYYREIDINKIADIDFTPVIDGSPYVVAGQTVIFGIDNLHGANSVVWEAPASLELVKYSSYKDYATYGVASSPQPGDTLRVRMSFTCRGNVTASLALAVRTEKPEIEDPEILACLPEGQDSVYVSVKNPLDGYIYWWGCMAEGWTVEPWNARGSEILLVTGGNDGALVLYATNAYATDTASNVYKVARCVETCEYDTLSGIDITEATCLRQGDTAVFRIMADPSATSYTWEFGGGWEPSVYVTENPYDTVVKVRVGFHKGWARVTGINCAGEWSMQTPDSIAISYGELRLQHYDGCVNLGIGDTLLLQVENPLEGLYYDWNIPENWQAIGCDTCGKFKVVTLENAPTTQVYSVSTSICDKALDTILVKGADTTLVILVNRTRYIIGNENSTIANYRFFDIEWYKGNFGEENIVTKAYYASADQFDGLTPLLKYRRKNEGCWSTTSEMVQLGKAQSSIPDNTSNLPKQKGDAVECIPNPTNNQVSLYWDVDIDRIEIISESGQRIRTFNVSGLQQKLVDMSHMQSGIYFVRFLSENSIVATKKLIKQ